MTVRTIAPHRHAIADVHDIICYYRELAGTAVAENFAIEIDCLDKGSNRDRASSGPSQFPQLQHYSHIPTFRGWYFIGRSPRVVFYKLFKISMLIMD